MPSTKLNMTPTERNNNQLLNLNYNTLPSIRLDMSGMDSGVAGIGEVRSPKFGPEISLPPFSNKDPILMPSLSASNALRRKSSVFPTLTQIPSIAQVDLSKRVDITSRFTFPALFLLFLSNKTLLLNNISNF